MNKNGIDDLLKVVSPELVTGYVARNFTAGSSLHAVNEEYKAVTQQIWISLGFDDWFKLAMFSVLIGMMLALYLEYRDLPVYVANLSMLAIVLPPILCFVWAFHKFKKEREIRYRCEPILRDFRQAVEASNPFRTTKQTFPYTADSVWGILVLLAIHVLEAKEKFLAECKVENPTIKRVQNCIVVEQGSRCMFNSAFEASSKFGLDFSKERIYQAAQDELANQWIRV